LLPAHVERSAPSFFRVLTDAALRLVSIAAISARDTFDFFASAHG
jgi:hypothetical protein